jgi:RNA polymerase sigma-70 factor, ECF subfamily
VPIPKEQFLLHRIRLFRDERAFNTLYEAYVDKVHRFLSGKLPTANDASDALGDVFLRTWQYVTVTEVESFSGLIFTIARRVIADFYHRRRETVPVDMLEQVLPDTHAAPDVIAEVGIVRKFLYTLPDEQRTALMMRHFEGSEISEIAAALDKTENATRVLLHRASKHLKRLIEKEGKPL